MNEEQVAALREKFPDEVVGKLPRVWCKACSSNKAQRHCDKHQLVRCEVCKQRITEAHLHLDYIGHATATDRLLRVDPEWTWTPVAHGQDGLPQLDQYGGLWINLTIAGVTRLGYGDAGDKKGPNAVKEAIGDAIRNAAMRFGVALYLWSKEDLHAVEESPPALPEPASPLTAQAAGGDEHSQTASTARYDQKSTLDVKEPDRAVITKAQRKKVTDLAGPAGYGMTGDHLVGLIDRVCGKPTKLAEVQRWQLDALLEAIELEGRGAQV